MPTKTLLTIYKSLFESHLTYCLPIWCRGLKSAKLKEILIQQKRAMRHIFKKKFNAHTDKLFVKGKCLKINDLCETAFAKIMYNFNCDNLNWEMSKFLHKQKQTNNTRQNGTLAKNFQQGDSTFINCLISHFNENKTLVDSATSKEHFSKIIKEKKLGNYQTNCTNPSCNECN